MAIIDYDDGKVSCASINEDEIIENFAELIRRSERAKTNQNLRSVISKLEENIRDNEKYIIKMFLVNMKTGCMINSDNAPNISFRVDTINGIFDSFAESVKGAGLTQEQTDKIFFDAGLRCGENFGHTFNKYIDTYIDLEETRDRIYEWCSFDSSVGWGKLGYDPTENTITITNNFETKRHDSGGKSPTDCSFFKGYVAGVLSEIATRGRIPEVTCASGENCPKKCDCRDCVLKFR